MKKKSNPHEGKLANSCVPMAKVPQKKKKSISNTIKANHFNQDFSNGEEATQKINHISHGKSIVEPSNNYSNKNTEQMDVDQAMGIQFQEDIIMEILSRLPVRYLVQYKCVSKLWKALISDPYFAKKHLNHAKNDRDSHKLLFYERSFGDYMSPLYCCPLSSVENVQKLDFPLNFSSAIYCVYNGLAIIRVTDIGDTTSSIFVLWNPSTRESIVLPDPEFPPHGCYCLGLGYDSTSGDYKILKIRNYSPFQRNIPNGIDGNREPGEILALKSGSWRNIDNHPCGICSQLAFVNDAFHWLVRPGNYFGVPRTHSLVSFSISIEVYGEIPLPEEILSLKRLMFIGVSALDGMLCVYSTFCHQSDRTFKLWVLNDYGVNESWNALFIVDDLRILKAIPKYRFADGEVLFWSLYVGSNGSFRTSKGPFGLRDAVYDGLAFTESLISPKSLI